MSTTSKNLTESRYWVYDRKVSPLTRFSSMNPRYWIIDRTTNLPADEATLKSTATAIARDLNKADS